MESEQTIERLIETFVGMKRSFEEQVRSLDQQIGQAQGYLVDVFERQKNVLADCLSGVDQKLLDCCVYIEEYKRLRSALDTLNERLSQLGAGPLQMPEPLEPGDVEGIIRARLEYLRSQGRLQNL